MKSIKRLAAVAAAVVGVTTVLGATPALAAQQTLCSSTYQGDRVAGKAFTDKGDHTVGGDTQGIDGTSVVCETGSTHTADHWVDEYKSGLIYKRVGDEYTSCAISVGGWRGTFTQGKYTWHYDLDDVSGKCGWSSNSIKVRHIAKGEWSNGTIKSVYVTTSAL